MFSKDEIEICIDYLSSQFAFYFVHAIKPVSYLASYPRQVIHDRVRMEPVDRLSAVAFVGVRGCRHWRRDAAGETFTRLHRQEVPGSFHSFHVARIRFRSSRGIRFIFDTL